MKQGEADEGRSSCMYSLVLGSTDHATKMTGRRDLIVFVLCASIVDTFWTSLKGISSVSLQQRWQLPEIDTYYPRHVQQRDHDDDVDDDEQISSASINNSNSDTATAMSRSTEDFLRLEFKKENLQEGPHICGAKKCMIPLKWDGSVGYLIANARQAGNLPWKMDQAYNFSTTIIKEQYNMSHVYLDAPYRFQVDKKFVNWIMKDRIVGYKGQVMFAKFPQHGQWLIQPIQVVPHNESILFGCESKRIKDGLLQLHLLGENFYRDKSNTIDYSALKERVSKEFEKMFTLLHDHPCLYDDFQIFMTTSGELIHMDIDRCFPHRLEYQYRKVEKTCLPLMKEFKDHVLSKITRFEQLYSKANNTQSN